MEIRTRKPRVLNLKKHKRKVVSVISPVIIPVKETEPEKPIQKPWSGGSFPCVDCKKKEAQEFGRCETCDSKHREVADRLDSVPRQTIEKVPQNFTVRKEVSRGVVVTITQTEPLRI